MSIYEPIFASKQASPARTSLSSAFVSEAENDYGNGTKRALDVLAIVLSAPFVVPFLALMAFFVWCGGGTPFYRQARVGRNNQIFYILKLRTMVHDADARLEACLANDPVARAEWDVTQKLKDDPRITTVGRILRKTSMDELPQLWNVLVGDMSLIGPRPMLPEQRMLYTGTAYYSLRPGITGSWQVSARNRSSFADRAKFDTEYSNRMSFIYDLKILARTVLVVLRTTGY